MIPVPLGKTTANNSLPPDAIRQIHELSVFFVENIRSAVRFLQWIAHPIPEFNMEFYVLDKNTSPEDLASYGKIIGKKAAGILSEAGAPGIADPGARLVSMAHRRNVPVVPLVGPSSILLALMASGCNGQQFCFNGYLPRGGQELDDQLRSLEKKSAKNGSAQVFMEAPYRNSSLMKQALEVLKPDTELCVAAALTLEQEFIRRYPVSAWKTKIRELPEGLPAIFVLQATVEPRKPLHKKPVPRKKRR